MSLRRRLRGLSVAEQSFRALVSDPCAEVDAGSYGDEGHTCKRHGSTYRHQQCRTDAGTDLSAGIRDHDCTGDACKFIENGTARIHHQIMAYIQRKEQI